MSSEDNKKYPEPELTRKGIVPLQQYGLLKVLEWPDGTIIHINTEKGKENMRIHHSSGTFYEFCSDGSKLNFNSNNHIEYSKGGVTVTCDNSHDVKSAGHLRINFDTDAHVTFAKNASIVVGGKADVAALGNLKVAAKGNLYLGADQGKVVINGGKGVEIRGTQGRVMIEASKGVCYIHSKEGDVHLQAGQDIVQASDQDNIVQAGGKVSEQSQGDNVIQAQGQLNYLITGDATYDSDGKIKIGPSASLVDVKPGGEQITPTDSKFV